MEGPFSDNADDSVSELDHAGTRGDHIDTKSNRTSTVGRENRGGGGGGGVGRGQGVQGDAIVEASAPLLSSFTTEKWRQFLSLYETYRHRGGRRSIFHLLDPRIFPAIKFHDSSLSPDTLRDLHNRDLIAKLSALFGEVTVTSSLTTIKRTAMAPSRVFSKEDFYTYVGDFSAAMEAATGIDDKVLVQLFYDGAQPPWFRDYLKHLDSGQARRFSDLSDTVRQGIQHASLHETISSFMKKNEPVAAKLRRDDATRLPVTTSVSPVAAGGGGKFYNNKPRKQMSDGGSAALAAQSEPVIDTDMKCFNCSYPHHFLSCPFQLCIAHGGEHAFLQCPTRAGRRTKKKDARHVRSGSEHSDDDGDDNVDAIPKVSCTVLTQPIGSDKTDIIIDSGGSDHFVHNSSYFDSPPVPLQHRETVAVANGAREQIDGRGLFLGEPADYVKNFDCSLYSVSKFVHSGDRVCIFEKGRMFGIDCSVNKSLIAAYQGLIDSAREHKAVRVTAKLKKGLYRTSFNSLSRLRSHSSPRISDPTPTSLGPKGKSANVSYYQTVKLDKMAEMVRFFHESWGHPNEEQMLDIVSRPGTAGPVFANIPTQLTPRAVRKYFPQCAHCIRANMHQRPIPKAAAPGTSAI
jgi:hypothetical protein